MRTECNECDCGPLTLTGKCIVEVYYCKFRNHIKFSIYVAMIVSRGFFPAWLLAFLFAFLVSRVVERKQTNHASSKGREDFVDAASHAGKKSVVAGNGNDKLSFRE